MANFDFKNLTGKLDIDSLVSNVKQMINPEDQMPHPEDGDKLGEIIAECSVLAHDLAREHEEVAKHSEQLHIKLNQLYKALRDDPKVKKAEEKAQATEQENVVEEAKVADKPANEPEVKAQAAGQKPEAKKQEKKDD